jgi:hypothetical protein
MCLCGPGSTQTDDKTGLNFAYYEDFFAKLWPAEAIFIELRIVEHMSFIIWPSDQFEFETPALECQILFHLNVFKQMYKDFKQKHFSSNILEAVHKGPSINDVTALGGGGITNYMTKVPKPYY